MYKILFLMVSLYSFSFSVNYQECESRFIFDKSLPNYIVDKNYQDLTDCLLSLSQDDQSAYFNKKNKDYNKIFNKEHSAFFLGLCYEHGIGTNADFVRASDTYYIDNKARINEDYWAHNARVRLVQKSLNILGYPVVIDGGIGNQTNSARDQFCSDYEIEDFLCDYYRVVYYAQEVVNTIDDNLNLFDDDFSYNDNSYVQSSNTNPAIWPKKDREEFLNECIGDDKELSTDYCYCVLADLESKFPNLHNSDYDEMLDYIETVSVAKCIGTMDVKSDSAKDSFMSECTSGESYMVKYCECGYNILLDLGYEYYMSNIDTIADQCGALLGSDNQIDENKWEDEEIQEFIEACVSDGYDYAFCNCVVNKYAKVFPDPNKEIADADFDIEIEKIWSDCAYLDSSSNDIILYEDFSDNLKNEWYEYDGFTYFENGYYVMNTNDDLNNWSVRQIDIDYNRNFEIETEIIFAKDADYNDTYGLIWGVNLDDSQSDIKESSYFLVSNGGDYHVGTHQDYKWTSSPFINIGNNSTNELKVQKIGKEYKFFINGTLVKTVPFSRQSFFNDSNWLGFTVMHPDSKSFQQIKINNISISYIDDVSTSSSSTVLSVDDFNDSSTYYSQLQYVKLFEENFNSNQNNWPDQKDDSGLYRIRSGKFKIDLNDDYDVLTGVSIDGLSKENFKISSDILLVDNWNKSSGFHGLFWGANVDHPMDVNDSFFYFIINPAENHYTIGKYDKQDYVYLDYSHDCDILNDKNNSLEIRRNNNQYEFYINNQLLSTLPYENTFGDNIGFWINNRHVSIDNLLVFKQESDPAIINNFQTNFSPTINNNLNQNFQGDDSFINNEKIVNNLNLESFEALDDKLDAMGVSMPFSNEYLIKTKDKSAAFRIPYFYNSSNNFDIKVNFKFASMQPGQFFFYWGNFSKLPMVSLSTDNRFIYNNNILEQEEMNSIITDKDMSRVINRTSDNELLIRKRDNIYEFYVNGDFISRTPHEPFIGDMFVVEASAYQEIHINNIVHTEYPEDKKDSSPSSLPGTYHALLIGVSDYKDPNWADLPSIDGELLALKNILESEYNFETVTVLNSPTESDIRKQFNHYKKKLKEDDKFLLVYSGHGLFNGDYQRSYWFPTESNPFENEGSWISDSDVKDFVAALDARHVLILSDACMSGAFIDTKASPTLADEVFEKERRKGRIIITATDSEEAAPGPSQFMRFIFQELNLHNGGPLSSEELYYRIRGPIKANTISDEGNNSDPDGNTPRRSATKGDEGGDFIFYK